jgi:hypothetical protein
MENGGDHTVNERLEQIEKTLQRLESALIGDKYSGGKGYIDKVQDHEKRIEQIEKNQNSLKWFIFGSGVTGGAGLVKLLESFF